MNLCFENIKELKEYIDMNQDASFYTDPDFQIKYWNKSFEKMYEIEIENSLDIIPLEKIDFKYSNKIKKELEYELAEKCLINQQVERTNKLGKKILINETIICFKNKSQNLNGFLFIDKYDLEKTLYEEKLVETNDFLHAVFQATPLAIIALDKEGKVTLWNPGAEKIFGWSESKVIGKILPFVPNDKMDEFKYHIDYVFNGKGFIGKKLKRINSNNEIIDVSLSTAPLRNSKGEITGILSVIEDITEKQIAEDALKKSEERHRIISELTSDFAFAYTINEDESSTEDWYTDALPKITGYSYEEVIAGGGWRYVVHPDDKILTDKRKENLLNGKSNIMEFRIITRDNNIKWLKEYCYSEWSFKENRVVRIFGAAQDITKQKNAEEKLHKSREQLRKLASHLEQVREKERTRISRELHDDLGQILTALKLDLSVITKKLNAENETIDYKKVSSELKSLNDIIDGLINRVREISSELRSPVLEELGLYEAIEWHINNFQKRSGIHCYFKSNLIDNNLNSDIANCLVKIMQEAFTNILRHSKANFVKIELFKFNDKIDFVIKDNGVGITKEEIENNKSLGLIGMKERVRSLNGKIQITGNPKKGTDISVEIPLAEKKNKEVYEY